VFEQCCSCLFVSGRTVVYRSHYKLPQFPPKVDFGGPNNRLQTSLVSSHVDWPSRTLLTVRPARQDGVGRRLAASHDNYSTGCEVCECSFVGNFNLSGQCQFCIGEGSALADKLSNIVKMFVFSDFLFMSDSPLCHHPKMCHLIFGSIFLDC